ncbi:MAG TPA: polysaccharide biosynthesis/export family protein [Caulobacter sp.]|nr:polysaccharide biosynthesis/export family protein [Caulobacter sp.]
MIRALVLAVATSLLLVACSGGGSGQLTEGAVYGQNLPPPDPTRAVIGAEEYRVGPMDTLDISVYQAPELTRVVQVDAAGQIGMPLIGSVTVAGKTVSEIRDDLTTRLKARYLKAPEVTVAVKEFASQKVTVDGSVMQPGVYPLIGKTTLIQTVAMARGLNREANEKKVAVFRVVNNQRMVAVFDLNMIRTGKMDDPQVYANDVIFVDRSGAKTLWRDVISSVPLIGMFVPVL